LGEQLAGSSEPESAKGGFECGKLKKSPSLEAVARERLVKIQQVRKVLADAVVNCKIWRLVVAL
jgi:hypothetical protein